MDMADWFKYAREFELSLNGRNIRISRYNNHGRLIPDGRWVAVYANGFNWEHYAAWDKDTERWVWKYKNYNGFSTPDDALSAARHAMASEILDRRDSAKV